MIYPKQNRFIQWWMQLYNNWLLRRTFSSINYNQLPCAPDQSILLIANHFSIWDGLTLYWINARLFKKKFHVMILEETSVKEPFLKYAGAFSVKKGSGEALASLDYAAALLNDPKNLVLIFPQGKLYSNFVDAVQFEKGIMRVISKSAGKYSLIFSATFMECFKNKKPIVNVYLTHEAKMDFSNIEQLQNSYHEHYNKSKSQQIKIIV
jgi:1-acyl-sn-glycerol-3-phosphate acyltransferase